VLHVAVSDAVWDGARVDPRRLAAVGRLGGSSYAGTEDAFSLRRPDWQEVRAGPQG
jgi:hypothetical protein